MSDASNSMQFSQDELQARLAAIVATSDDAIISKDLNGIIQSWNGSAERIFGYKADEIIGKSILTLIPPERSGEETQILQRLMRGERIDHFQTIRVRKDGTRIPVSVTISPIRNSQGKIVAASKILRDLSQSSQMAGMFEAIVASSDDAIVGKDLNGVVRSWNAAAERIFGYSAAEMIGRPISILIPADRQNEEPQILERLKRGDRVDHFETVRVRKDGQQIDVSVTISPIRGPTGEVIGASKIARDVTTLKRVLEEREMLLKSEQNARRDAERVNRVKDEFLATLSHELRTPLNAILGWAQLLQSGTVAPEDLTQGLETIERNARIQTRLVEELLDISRIISGKIRLDVQPLDLPAIVSESIESVRPAANAKGIKLYKVLDSKAGPVMGDSSRIQQVIWNLLTNAIKYTPRGGSVQVYLRRVNSHLEITVTDTGQGIKPEFLPQLFTRFAQADSSTTRRHGGLGLGLAIVRHLVELHGGTVRAFSQGENEGATFTVSLPLTIYIEQRTPEEASHPAAPAPAGPFAMDLSGVKALIVDDEPDSLALLRRVLEKNRASVITADSGNAALELLKRERPDVLLSDIGMPDMDGYQFLAHVRALSPAEGGSTPAAAITAFARSEDRRRALMAGFQLHVAKPVEASELLAVVANLSGLARRVV
jgi:PAS domain S-box-containing protein